MNSKADVLALLFEDVDELGDGVLGLGHTQAVAGHDHDVVGLGDHLDGLVRVHLGVRTRNLHGLTLTRRRGTVTAQDHVRQGPVHGL